MRILGNHLGTPARRRGLTLTGLYLGALLWLGTSLGPSPAAAQGEPPIRSAEDAFCRSEARAQVFSAPDPLNLGLREIGRRIWASCMERTQRKGQGKGQKSRKRRHR
ncbi:hypothetical protein MPPM_4301 [Methylorubrum populi]|uniref:Uncharacterized protein n=1 Tax=Methylorubrum populi TaxID=223967 RepID=A0A160PIW6_9HYPH|nr:hypothetical protein [Methylorubrum populi]BAU92906.1 hypothetical protein MPPM_4301 [Methylorubrum populi]